MSDSCPGSRRDGIEAEEQIVEAELVAGGLPDSAAAQPGMRRRRRRKKLPAILFLLTCASTFWVGAARWYPDIYLYECATELGVMPIRRVLLSHWQDGLIYMACLVGILLMHEMGHFLATVRYGVPASLPFFLPFPVSPVGTMGAVIAMDGTRANRRQMFDIGLAGPLAGLVVAVPILWIGVRNLDGGGLQHGPFVLDLPLGLRFFLDYTRPQGFQPGTDVWFSQLNPYFMAGWVGLLVTGLNMLPVGQLDGGHVVYTLFGRRAHWISRGFMLVAMVYIGWDLSNRWPWTVMAFLLLLLGVNHPPTRDDSVPLGWFRTVLGVVSLSIPVLCFPLQVFKIVD
jgi:membrane-associated protease RseP (regulator of RpoE activity)